MDTGLSGRRVLVTGGTRGIGRETALAFARAGARVVACGRTAGEAADSLARELKGHGDGHRVVQADVTDAADVAVLAQNCREALGGLDVVVNNAGVDGWSALGELTGQEWHRVINANLTSAFLVTQAAADLLADGGTVVCIGASAGLRGRPNSAHYSASKAGLVGLTRALAKELGGRGIRVNAVAPGVVVTGPDGPPPPVAQRISAMTALGRLGTSADVAAAVLFLAGDGAAYITGAVLNVDGGM